MCVNNYQYYGRKLELHREIYLTTNRARFVHWLNWIFRLRTYCPNCSEITKFHKIHVRCIEYPKNSKISHITAFFCAHCYKERNDKEIIHHNPFHIE